MSTVVRFPTEQCRLPGESREAFKYRQADEQFWRGGGLRHNLDGTVSYDWNHKDLVADSTLE